MTIFLFIIGIAQCFLIWGMGQAGLKLQTRAKQDHEMARITPPHGWPVCAVIIPVAGISPLTEIALKSILEQDYPAYEVFMVTQEGDQAAALLAENLADYYPILRHVVAEKAVACGQKNMNLLTGVRSSAENTEVFVFCDSTHVAPADFLRCLLNPIARGETTFSTGYHQVWPRDNNTVTLAYAMSVLFMRLLQGMAALTQPWGGAMAMTRHAFVHYKIAELWETNVVDDCSLAALLQRLGVHARLCPGALLATYAQQHPLKVWRNWLTRQVLFLKFCIPSQWLGLGILCATMIAPPIWAAICILRGLIGIGGGMSPFLALCWLLLLVWAVNNWRRLLPDKTGSVRWVWAFFCSCAMFALVYAGTIWTNTLVWSNNVYRVKIGGIVKAIERK